MNIKKIALYAFAIAGMSAMYACSDDNDNNNDEPTPPTPPAVVEVESVTVDPTTLSLEIGETATLTATYAPSEAEANISWTTSDASVATVAEDGVVTAVAAGEAVITATAGEKTADCTVTVTKPQPAPVVGDFFYSDGTWSTDADYTKSIIGVVFWVGDPTADDALLRKDHPGCTHGLVVSLDHKQLAWQTNYEGCGTYVYKWVKANTTGFEMPASASGVDQPIQKINGYNNTKAIEAFNAAPENAAWPVEVVAYATEYRSEVPAPYSTSDWYIPSPKELSLLCAGELEGDINILQPVCTNLNVINPRLEEAEGTPMTLHSYWTSMENADDTNALYWMQAWNYCFDPDERRPLSASFKAWNEYARCRCVLAF